MPKSSADQSAAKPYAAPTLKIYGDVTKLTAGGTGPVSETPGNTIVSKKP